MRWMVSVLLALGAAMAWSQDTGTGKQTTGISKSRSQDMVNTQLLRLLNPDTLFKPTAGYSQLGEVLRWEDGVHSGAGGA
jgi:hypothetical protein